MGVIRLMHTKLAYNATIDRENILAFHEEMRNAQARVMQYGG